MRRKEWSGETPGHDSSIMTSAVGMCVGLGPRSRATASPPSAFARTYKDSRASSSAVRFARERRASASCQRKKFDEKKNKKTKIGGISGSPKAAYLLAVSPSMQIAVHGQSRIWLEPKMRL